MLAMFASPIARIVGLAAVILTGVWFVYNEGKRNGAASVRSEIAAENKRRLDRAILADDDAKRCAADPSCRLQSDGFRRD